MGNVSKKYAEYKHPSSKYVGCCGWTERGGKCGRRTHFRHGGKSYCDQHAPASAIRVN